MLHLKHYRVLIFLVVISAVSGIGSLQRRGYQIPFVKDGEKWEKNGSVVIYTNEKYVNEHQQKKDDLLIRVVNHLSNYNVKLKKVDCSTTFKSNKKCRHISEEESYIVYVFKGGEEKLLTERKLNGTHRAINEVLFFLGSVGFENLIYCSNDDQKNEVILMSLGLINVVVGSFRRLDGDDMQHFLEAAMEIGHDITFVMMDRDAVDKSKFKLNGYFVDFHLAMHSKPGENVVAVDISQHLSSTKSLVQYLKTFEMVKEMADLHGNAKRRQKELDDALIDLKSHETEKIKRLKKGELVVEDETKKNLTFDGKPITDWFQEGAKRMKSKYSIQEADEDEELTLDVFKMRNEDLNFLPDNDKFALQQDGFYKLLDSVNKTRNQLLLVMFVLPWDPQSILFKEKFNGLATGYEADDSLNLRTIDCHAWPTPCQEYRVHTFPLIMTFKSRMPPFLYSGFLDVNQIRQHISLWKEDFLPILTETRQLKELSKELHGMFFMGVFNQGSDVTVKRSFKQTALHFYGKLRIGALKLKKKLREVLILGTSVTIPSVLCVHANNITDRLAVSEEFQESFLKMWIEQQRQNDVEKLTAESFPRISSLGKPLLISFYSANKSLASLAKLSRKHALATTTVWMDMSHPSAQRIHKSYNLKHDDAIMLLKQDNVYEYLRGKRTVKNVSDWLEDCLLGLVESSYKLPRTVWRGKEGIDFLKKMVYSVTNTTEESMIWEDLFHGSESNVTITKDEKSETSKDHDEL